MTAMIDADLRDNIWLLTLTGRRTTTGAARAFYFGSHGYTTEPTDALPSQYFAPYMKDGGSFDVDAFKAGTTFGGSNVGLGILTLLNTNVVDETLDQIFEDYTFDDAPYILEQLVKGSPFSSRTVLSLGTVNFVETAWRQAKLHIFDYQKQLDIDLQDILYAGTNTGGNGVEGSVSDIINTPKPFAFGEFRNATPVMVNPSKLTYQINSYVVKEITNVYDGRNDPAITFDADYATIALLEAASVSSGEYATCIAEGLIRLGTKPTKGVTVDGKGVEITNLALRSDDLSNATWTKTNSSITANAVADPFGTTLADKITEDTSNGLHQVRQTITVADSAKTTYSAYVKAGTRFNGRLTVEDAGGSGNQAYVAFNLATGAFSTGSAVSGVIVDGGIRALDDGWFRVWVVGHPGAGITSAYMRLNMADSNGNASYVGDGTSYMYAVGFMASRGYGVMPYIPTTSATVSKYPEAATEIAETLLYWKGNHDYSDIDYASLGDLYSANSAPLNWYQGNTSINFRAVLDRVLSSVGAWWSYSETGKFICDRVVDPNALTPVLTLDSTYLMDDGGGVELLSMNDDGRGVPNWQVQLGYKVNWTPMGEGDVVSSATADDRMWLPNPDLIDEQHDDAVKAVFRSSVPFKGDTLFTNQTDCRTETTRQLNLRKVRRKYMRIKAPVSVVASLRIGSIIKIQVNRFGLGSGLNVAVLGTTDRVKRNQRELRVYG